MHERARYAPKMATIPIADGETWAFRKGKRPLQRVTILKVTSQNGRSRVRIQFEEGELEGQAEWVHRRMLKTLWTGRQAFLEHEHRWTELRQAESTIPKTDLDAAEVILEETFDLDVASPHLHGVLRVHDLQALKTFMQGVPLHAEGAFDEDNLLHLLWPAMLEVARLQANVVPQILLEYVEREAAELFTEDQRQRQLEAFSALSGPPSYGHAQHREFVEERRRYLNRIREWCGQDSIGKWDEIQYLRGDNARIAGLMQEALVALEKAGSDRDVKRLRRELGYPFIPWHKRLGEPDPLDRE